MKKLLTILKLINNWTNHQISAEEEAAQILKYLLLKNDTKRVIEVYRELKKLTSVEMRKQEVEALEKARLIQGEWGSKYPTCEKPLDEIKVVYEKIN